jgi:acyl-CoA thioester hydrolase
MSDITEYLLNHSDSTVVKVRFNDTDAMGIVHFMNYMMYFDDGFVSFMNSLGTSRKVEELIHQKIALGVKHVEVSYEGSARFGDYILVETTLEELGSKSMIFRHKLYRESDKTLLADVKAVRFVMDLNTKSLMNVKEFFSNFVEI